MSPETQAVLTNLVIEQIVPRGWSLPPSDRARLIGAIEEALIDRERLEPIFEHLRSISKNPALQRSESIFDDEDVEVVLDGGLAALYDRSAEQFALAVVDPFALLELRDNIYANLPPYWWHKIRHLDGREPLDAETIWQDAAERAHRGVALTALDAADGPRRWTVRLGAGQVRRISPADGPTPPVVIEFSLSPGPGGWQLEADILEPLPAVDRRRAGRLVTSGGEVIAEVADEINLLAFPITPEALSVGVVFECEDKQGPDDHVQYRVRVDPG